LVKPLARRRNQLAWRSLSRTSALASSPYSCSCTGWWGAKFFFSGSLAQAYGWRVAWLWRAPALILIPALLLLPEPARGASEFIPHLSQGSM